MKPEIVVLGYVTKDIIRINRGSYKSVGGALYPALALSKLGWEVGLVSKVGHDFNMDVLKNSNIDLRGLRVVDRETTKFENIYDKRRKQKILSLCERIWPADIPKSYWGAKFFYLDPIYREVDPKIINLVSKSKIALDAQGYCRQNNEFVKHKLWEKFDLKLLDKLFLLKCSEREARLLKALKARCEILIITLGGRGSLIYSKGNKIRTKAFKAKVKDPTGAGDAFTASFLSEYSRSGDLDYAAKFASCFASFVVEKVGLCIPDREEVEKRLKI